MNPLLAAADVSAVLNLVAQITGILGTAMCFFMFVARKRRTILLGKFTCDVLWTMHYGLIGAYSGAALNVLAMGRETVFYNKDKKWASSRIWLYLFVGMMQL